MRSSNIDMTKGNLWKQIFIFSAPLIMSNVLQLLFNMSDVAVIGNFSGSDSLGAVGSTAILVTLLTAFVIGVGNGVNSIVAKYIGAKDEKSVKSTIHTSFIAAVIIGLLVLLFGLFLSKPILGLIKTKDELMDKALLYTRIYSLGIPGLALYNFGSAIYSSKGDTRRPLIFLTISGVINVILNLLFVIVFKMDVAGVALATIISFYLSAIMVITGLCKTNDICHFSFKEIKFDWSKTKEVLMIALPSGFQYSIFAIANLFVQSGVNSFDTTMVAGNTAATNADSIIYDVMAAFYVGCTSFISQNYGAGNKKRILSTYFIAMLYSFFIALLLGGLLMIFGRQFLSIFTNEEAVIEAGMKKVRIMSFSYCVSAFMDNTLAASRGLGKTLVPVVVEILGSCIFRIIWIYTVFAYFHTIPSLYLLYLFSWTLTAIGEIIYFIYIYKKIFSTSRITLK